MKSRLSVGSDRTTAAERQKSDVQAGLTRTGQGASGARPRHLSRLTPLRVDVWFATL